MFVIKSEGGIINFDMIENIHVTGDKGRGYALIAETNTYYTGGNSHNENRYMLTRRMDEDKATEALNKLFAAMTEGASGFDFTIYEG